MAKRITYVPNRVIDTNGIADGATIDVFETGGTTPVTIYSDEALTTPISNPYTVAAGAAVPAIYHNASGNIRVRIKDSGGATISDDDPFERPLTDVEIASTASGKGAGLVGTTGGSTVQAELDDRIYLQANIDKTTGAAIDSTLSGSFVVAGPDATYANKVGVVNAKPTDEPSLGARTADASYVAGGADVSAVLGGYDNVNNGLAGFIASQHSMLYTGADHASIWGGSLNTIQDDTDYSVIVGGTNCEIQARGRYAAIIASDQCQLLTGASDTLAGFRGFIGSSLSTTINGRNSVAIGCVSADIDGSYCTVLSGNTVTIGTTTSNCLALGSNLTIGATTAANNSLVIGSGHTVDGGRNLVVGDSHDTNDFSWSVVTGTGCIVPMDGARVHGARQRGGTAGNNMALDFTCSQETTDTTTTRLAVIGSSTYPKQPANSIVTGAFWIVGVKDDGTSSAYRIDFSSLLVGAATGTPTIKGLTLTTLHNDLALGTAPTVVSTSTGIYRVQVVGLAATNIRWMARFVGQQVVWG